MLNTEWNGCPLQLSRHIVEQVLLIKTVFEYVLSFSSLFIDFFTPNYLVKAKLKMNWLIFYTTHISVFLFSQIIWSLFRMRWVIIFNMSAHCNVTAILMKHILFDGNTLKRCLYRHDPQLLFHFVLYNTYHQKHISCCFVWKDIDPPMCTCACTYIYS